MNKKTEQQLQENVPPKKRPNRKRLLFAAVLLTVICLCAGAVGGALVAIPRRVQQLFGPPAPALAAAQRYQLTAFLYIDAKDLTTPADSRGGEQNFTIELGESVASIVRRLGQSGLVTNAAAFRTYLVYTGLDTQLQAGEYTLSPAMTAIEIADALLDATPAEITFIVLPGWRIEEIAEALPTSGLSITPEAFLAAAQQHPEQYLFPYELPDRATTEGFLIAGEYTFAREAGVQEFLVTLLYGFETQMTDELLQGFANQGQTLYDAVILASIVQREAVVTEEQPLIASVFFNRLVQGMKLDADPTVQYALGYDPAWGNWWKSPLSLDDLYVDSYYNTYQHPSLPPGPIASPTLSALRAAAFPAQTPYYFFRAACDGSRQHSFAVTFEEHQGNACP